MAHHLLGDFFRRGVGDGPRGDEAAVAEHGVPVGKGEDLRHLVGDEEKRGAVLFFQAAQDRKQVVHLPGVEGGGGLVQDDEFCLAPQDFGDFQ